MCVCQCVHGPIVCVFVWSLFDVWTCHVASHSNFLSLPVNLADSSEYTVRSKIEQKNTLSEDDVRRRQSSASCNLHSSLRGMIVLCCALVMSAEALKCWYPSTTKGNCTEWHCFVWNSLNKRWKRGNAGGAIRVVTLCFKTQIFYMNLILNDLINWSFYQFVLLFSPNLSLTVVFL